MRGTWLSSKTQLLLGSFIVSSKCLLLVSNFVTRYCGAEESQRHLTAPYLERSLHGSLDKHKPPLVGYSVSMNASHSKQHGTFHFVGLSPRFSYSGHAGPWSLLQLCILTLNVWRLYSSVMFYILRNRLLVKGFLHFDVSVMVLHDWSSKKWIFSSNEPIMSNVY